MRLFRHSAEPVLGRLPAADKAQVYAVGGCVRDLLLGKPPQDYDLAVRIDPALFAARTAAALRGRQVLLGRGDQRIYRVVAAGATVDIAPIAGASIQDDLRQRDFTVNALACDLATAELIDCTGGQADLRRGIVRMVSIDGLRRDPLRLVRAYRLAVQFAWELDPATTAAIRSEKARVRTVAGERIWTEIQKILSAPHALPAVEQMIATGLLTEILPELERSFSPETRRRRPVAHIRSACAALERLLQNPGEIVPTGLARFSAPQLQADIPAALLKLALLLHEIDPPQGSASDDPAERAAASARRVCRRLRTSVRQADYVGFILRHHRRPADLYHRRRRRKSTRRERVRFFLDCHPLVPDILLLAAADQLAEFRVEDADEAGAFKHFVRSLFDEYYREMRPRIEAPPLLTGNDLIQVFHLEPSPRFRRILAGLKEARLMGEIRNRTDALNWVRARIGGHEPA